VSRRESIRQDVTTTVAGALGVAQDDAAVASVVDALMVAEPWIRAEDVEADVHSLVNRDGVAEILGVGARSVSEYALRDPDFPKPATVGRLWSSHDINAYQKLRRETRRPGRPIGSVNKKERA
jgi:hypothetical protein